jgi:formamidopyrimidine-DNA glycosylase
VIDLDDGAALLIHLGMTGQLRVVPAQEPALAHTHLVAGLDRGEAQLRFRDVRRFGSATLVVGPEALADFFGACGLGPEPFDLDAPYWRRQLRKTSRCLKAVLLDQRVVAGVGNIYADEALFEARLHPRRLGRTLSAEQAERLRRAIMVVLERAIDRRGSTIRDYVGASGAEGGYQHEFRVYGRPGEACPRCRRAIERIRLAGRSTHFCPRCQRRPVAPGMVKRPQISDAARR